MYYFCRSLGKKNVLMKKHSDCVFIHLVALVKLQTGNGREVKTFILSHFPIQKPFFKRYYFIHCRNDNNNNTLVNCKIIHIYIYIYIFNIQNTLHIRSSTDPFSLIMHVKHGSKGYIRIVSLCYKLHVPFFLFGL